MKKIFFLSIAIISFSSCKKCYQCTIIVKTTTTPNLPSANSYGISTTEFCGTNKEKDEFVKGGTMTTTAYSGNVKVVQETKTTCQQKK
jgi:hypothetical protein